MVLFQLYANESREIPNLWLMQIKCAILLLGKVIFSTTITLSFSRITCCSNCQTLGSCNRIKINSCQIYLCANRLPKKKKLRLKRWRMLLNLFRCCWKKHNIFKCRLQSLPQIPRQVKPLNRNL